MTFQQYIDNPLGKKNAVFSNREMYKTMYTEKFGAVNLREAGKVNFQLFYAKKADHFYCCIKIPSEVVPKFYYDVVVKFYTNDNGLRTASVLDGYDVQFFSNDPSFVYTYLRVFLKNGMFVEEVKEKASKLALKKDPVEKNPYELPGYVKSIYFAYLYMKKYNLFTKATYTNFGSQYDKRKILSLITDTDTKIADRQREGERVAAEKRKEKQQIHKSAPTPPNKQSKSSTIKTVKHTPSISTIATTKLAKTPKAVQRTKIIKGR